MVSRPPKQSTKSSTRTLPCIALQTDTTKASDKRPASKRSTGQKPSWPSTAQTTCTRVTTSDRVFLRPALMSALSVPACLVLLNQSQHCSLRTSSQTRRICMRNARGRGCSSTVEFSYHSNCRRLKCSCLSFEFHYRDDMAPDTITRLGERRTLHRRSGDCGSCVFSTSVSHISTMCQCGCARCPMGQRTPNFSCLLLLHHDEPACHVACHILFVRSFVQVRVDVDADDVTEARS